jgi:hypothetical protein
LRIGVLYFANSGVIDQDLFRYRLLRGVFVFFLVGHFLYRRDVLALFAIAIALVAVARLNRASERRSR